VDVLDDAADVELTDDELTAEALAADPDAAIDADAIPFDTGAGAGMALLPQWYMPAPSLRRSRGRVLVLGIVAASLAAGNVVGFCVTFGVPEFVWG
jgi:hypothetical protein